MRLRCGRRRLRRLRLRRGCSLRMQGDRSTQKKRQEHLEAAKSPTGIRTTHDHFYDAGVPFCVPHAPNSIHPAASLGTATGTMSRQNCVPTSSICICSAGNVQILVSGGWRRHSRSCEIRFSEVALGQPEIPVSENAVVAGLPLVLPDVHSKGSAPLR